MSWNNDEDLLILVTIIINTRCKLVTQYASSIQDNDYFPSNVDIIPNSIIFDMPLDYFSYCQDSNFFYLYKWMPSKTSIHQ